MTRLSELEDQFKAYESDDDAQEQDSEQSHTYFIGILRDACALVREAEVDGSSDLEAVRDRVDRLINAAVKLSYGESDLWDYMPSFAHSDDYPLLEDRLAEYDFSAHALTMFMPLMQSLLKISKGEPFPAGFRMPNLPTPWHSTMKPHPNTTPLARFREGIPPLSATTSTPMAAAMYEARCEISGMGIRIPINMSITSGGSCLSLLGCGGYKNRTPYLSYIFPDGDCDGDFPTIHQKDIGLSGIAYHSTMDEPRKLIFVGDDSRVKSYAWGHSGKHDKSPEEPFPTHTLNSTDFTGPLAVMNGRVIRAGKGSAAVWNIEKLETHGPEGTTIIGEELTETDSWRDDPENIEMSIGSSLHDQISFRDKAFMPARWHVHPTIPGNMLCASDPQITENYSCVTVDLENSGKTVTRYLGHGGTVEGFSTSESDLNIFVTACSDGFARIYDVRHPLPMLTLNAGRSSQTCPAALIVHPDGIPTIFTGTESSEHIKLWDIRARAAVYELATGNNAVTAMAWDSKHNALYAATECRYVDRMGDHHDYRRAKVPKAKIVVAGGESSGEDKGSDGDEDNDDEDDDEDDDDEDDDDEDECKCWPKQAHHAEDYFGYMLDAGEHTIYRYTFKTNADNTILPAYGDATLHSGRYW